MSFMQQLVVLSYSDLADKYMRSGFIDIYQFRQSEYRGPAGISKNNRESISKWDE